MRLLLLSAKTGRHANKRLAVDKAVDIFHKYGPETLGVHICPTGNMGRDN